MERLEMSEKERRRLEVLNRGINSAAFTRDNSPLIGEGDISILG